MTKNNNNDDRFRCRNRTEMGDICLDFGNMFRTVRFKVFFASPYTHSHIWTHSNESICCMYTKMHTNKLKFYEFRVFYDEK